eukprot:Amastigsp_a340198_54.p3 type:complete len:218 gc:universal Amastigsp_a340198_54:595-1248(+)
MEPVERANESAVNTAPLARLSPGASMAAAAILSCAWSPTARLLAGTPPTSTSTYAPDALVVRFAAMAGPEPARTNTPPMCRVPPTERAPPKVVVLPATRFVAPPTVRLPTNDASPRIVSSGQAKSKSAANIAPSATSTGARKTSGSWSVTLPVIKSGHVTFTVELSGELKRVYPANSVGDDALAAETTNASRTSKSPRSQSHIEETARGGRLAVLVS